MNNFLCTRALEKMARRLAAKISLPHAAARFEHVARKVFCAEPACAALADPLDLGAAPEWALRALAAGDPVHVFTPDPDTVKNLRRIAADLRAACQERADLAAKTDRTPLDTLNLATLEDFLAKIGRMTLPSIAAKAKVAAAARRRRRAAVKSEIALFGEHMIACGKAGSWRRIVSKAELGRLGIEMRNCLAPRSGSHSAYAKRFTADTARFWVLRIGDGAALIAAMTATKDGALLEVRGPRNAIVPLEHGAVKLLGAACRHDAKRTLSTWVDEDAPADKIVVLEHFRGKAERRIDA